MRTWRGAKLKAVKIKGGFTYEILGSFRPIVCVENHSYNLFPGEDSTAP